MTDEVRDTPEEEARARLKDLAKPLSKAAKGGVQVLGANAAKLAGLLEGRGLAARAVEATDGDADTTLAFEALDVSDASGLDRLWANVPERGALFVCARNADAPGGGRGRAAVPPVSRRALRGALERFGKVQILRDPPFRWVVGVVRKGAQVNEDTRRRLDAVATLCRGRVLELGSGRGHLAAAIAARGCKVVGVELSASKVEMARRFHPALDFRQGDILALPDDLGTFDGVVMAEVLEHVPPETGRRFLDVAWSRLAPGGRLVISTPYEDMVPHPNHVTEFTAGSLREALSPFGPARLWDHQPLRWLLASVDKDPR